MNRGILYGVSVGPGDSELLTLKALRVLRECPVIAAPRTSGGDMAALDIIRPVVDIGGKRIIGLDLTMSADAGTRASAHDKAAGLLRQELAQGQSVAMLNLGDVSLYASFQYMAERLQGEFDIEMIAGVPSFCAAAARLGIGLTDMGKPLHLIPVSMAQGNPDGGTRVYMKSGKQLPALLDALEQSGELGRAELVQNCGMENERIYHGEKAKDAPCDYFSIVIVKE